MTRHIARLWTALLLLVTLTAGAAPSSPVVRMVCRMSGLTMPLVAAEAAPAGCCAAEAVHAPSGAFAGYELAVPGCCDIETSPGVVKAPAVTSGAGLDLGAVWVPAVPALAVPTPRDAAVRVFFLADLTGPRPPPNARCPARAPPFLS